MTDHCLPQSTTDDQLGAHGKFDQHRYWELKALETVSKYFPHLLFFVSTETHSYFLLPDYPPCQIDSQYHQF